MRRLARLGLLAAWLWGFEAGPAPAAPLYYDFEQDDGTWSIDGSARWEEVDVLGGNHAIYGNDMGSLPGTIYIMIDLTDIASLTLEQLWKNPPPGGTNLVTVMIYQQDKEGIWRVKRPDRDGTSLIATEDEPFPMYDIRSFDISGFEGPAWVLIQWNQFACPIVDFCLPLKFTGWVDNIRFHPVPEPGTAALLALGLCALARLRDGIGKPAQEPPRP